MTPTEELMMEVLAARERCGETYWTFPKRMSATARKLEEQGLVNWKSGIVEDTIMVWLTDKGRDLLLSDTYVPPILAERDNARANSFLAADDSDWQYSTAAVEVDEAAQPLWLRLYGQDDAEPRKEWWIGRSEGDKRWGPFHSRDLALEMRTFIEMAYKPETFWVFASA